MHANPDIFYYDTLGTFIGSNNNSYNILTNDDYAADCGLNTPNSFGPAMGHITNLFIDDSGLADNFSISPGGLITSTNNG